jgi:hypothetical protein
MLVNVHVIYSFYNLASNQILQVELLLDTSM